MSFSSSFIRRPIGTTLMATGLFLVGAVAYIFLPTASLPNVELPIINVSASRPGANPNTMAATVAAPLERRIGEIAGVTELTSVSSFGSSHIVVQFDLSRNIEGAARDVQAAINGALSDLPGDMPTLPTFRKFNPAATPILILALTSETMQPSDIYDVADSIIAQRLSQVDGVGDVTVAGSEQPATRIRADTARLTSLGLSLEDLRTAIANANAASPLGSFDGQRRAVAIGINDQLRNTRDYDSVVVKTVNGTAIHLSSLASIEPGVRNSRSAAWFNHKPSVLLVITKRADANVIETVDRIHALLPELKRWIPAALDISVLADRTQTIRSSVYDMQITIGITIFLVMMVVFLFIRRSAATLAAGITVPLSLAGTCAAMWLVGFSIDNLSLMALAVSIGFVVDDAIVMIENAFRYLEAGYSPLRAAVKGAKQIGFTVISISVSLIAALIPLLFMGGIVGKFVREFSVTLAFAIAISTVVSLSVTPMVCAYFVRTAPSKMVTWLDRRADHVLSNVTRFYDRTLIFAIGHPVPVALLFVASIVITFVLFIQVPKGYFPQDDTGLISGSTRASTDISFEAMEKLQKEATNIILADAAVSGVGSSIGASGFNASINNGRLFISLKPIAQRHYLSTQQVVARLRVKLNHIPGLRVFMVPAQDLRAGGRQSSSQYQFTLWSADIEALQSWLPKVLERVKQLPGIVDVTTDREQDGLQATVDIDRMAAARLGLHMQDIDDALNNAFSQRQISTIYSERNQYHVILEADQAYLRDPADLTKFYVSSGGHAQVPLSAVATIKRDMAPLVVNHQGQFPSVTITYNLSPDTTLEQATTTIAQAIAELHLPDFIHSDFAGDAQAFKQNAGIQSILLLAALFAIYIVLGVLYESLLHPLTIISTLPSAGLGALLALQISQLELTVIAFIGIILLIGIVKKNGIMMVDFALDGERQYGLSPERAIHAACLERFRPILMTTIAAILGAVPLVTAMGPGSELRRPLGITIIGGLLLSQALTLYTTPVIYLLLDRLRRRMSENVTAFMQRLRF